MSFYFPNIDQVFVYKRKGDVNDPFIPLNETSKKVLNGKVLLREIPDFQSTIIVKNSSQVALVETSNGTLLANQFRVDYSVGIVFVHSSLEGQNISISYMGTGYVSFPAERVWVDGVGAPVTLQNFTDEARAALDDLIGTDIGSIESKIGTMSSLQTVNKASLVGAINEIHSELDDVPVIADSAVNGNIIIDSQESVVYTHPANHPASMITQDANNLMVTTAEKTSWNAKASTNVATTSSNGLLPSTDKTKLNDIDLTNKVDGYALQYDAATSKVVLKSIPEQNSNSGASINDATNSSTTETWSTSKINAELDTKANSNHKHALSDLFEPVVQKINGIPPDADGNVIIKGTTIDVTAFPSLLYKSFEKFLNHQKVLYSINTLLGGYSDFPQGFSFNQEANELYVARQLNEGTEVKISRYSLPDCSLIDTKSFVKSTGAYQEGLPYFYDVNNKLCFLVRTTFSDNLAIFNYNDGTLGNNIPVIGGSKVSMDINKRYFITSFGSADRTDGAYIYDFNSVVSGSPVLIKTVYFPNSIADGEKTQGLTIIDDKIVLGQGKTHPCLTVLDFNGVVLKTVEMSKSELGVLTSSFDGQVVDTSNYTYENEGVSFYTYNGLVIPIVFHIVGSKCYFTLCGLSEFTKINTSLNLGSSVSNAINWKRPTFLNSVTDYSSSIIVRYGKNNQGQVILEGVCTHPYTSLTPNLILFNLPYPYRPRQNVFRSSQASGGADKLNRIEIRTNGDVVLVSTTSSVTTPFTTLDGVIFST